MSSRGFTLPFDPPPGRAWRAPAGLPDAGLGARIRRLRLALAAPEQPAEDVAKAAAEPAAGRGA